MGLGIFEFTQDWSTSYFILFVGVSFVITFLCQKAAAAKGHGAVETSRFYYCIAFLILFSLAAFRSDKVGNDTEEYVEFFETMGRNGFAYAVNSKFEVFFNIYIFIISAVSKNYTILFMCNACITVGVLIKYISLKWKMGDSFVLLPLFIIGFQYDLSAMRSGLGTAFILASLIALDNEKYMKSIFLSIAGGLFHTTAFFNLFIIFAQILLKMKKRWKAKTLFWGAVLGILVLNGSIYYIQSILLETRYQGYVRKLGNGWFGNWYLILAAILSAVIIGRSYRKKVPAASENIVNLLVLSMLPVYVRLNAYRIPKYYLMCRCSTYKTFCNIVESRQPDFQSKMFAKIIEFMILAFGLLYFFSRNAAGTLYELRF